MVGSNDLALDSNGVPVDGLTAKFADIVGSQKLAQRLVRAAAGLVMETTGQTRPTVFDVERILFTALFEPVPNIVHHPKSGLLRQFVTDDSTLSDDEVELLLNFLVGHVAVKMQGEVAELLAFETVIALINGWRNSGLLPSSVRLIPGSTIRMRRDGSAGWYKGADGLIACLPRDNGGPIEIYGIVEVKSYQPSLRDVMIQLRKHQSRLTHGLKLEDVEWPAERLVFAVRERDTWQTTRIGMPPSSLPILLVSTSRKSKVRRKTPPHNLVECELDVPQEEMTACGLSLVTWVIERLGDKFFPVKASHDDLGMDPGEAALNGYLQALNYTVQRRLGPTARANAIKLYDTHFGKADAADDPGQPYTV